MTWTLTTSGAAVIKAGANQNSTVSGSYMLGTWCDEAEGRIVAETKTDWITYYSTLDARIKNILSDVCSSLIAMKIINYDMSGYTSRQEAGTMLDVNDDIVTKGLKILSDPSPNKLKTP